MITGMEEGRKKRLQLQLALPSWLRRSRAGQICSWVARSTCQVRLRSQISDYSAGNLPYFSGNLCLLHTYCISDGVLLVLDSCKKQGQTQEQYLSTIWSVLSGKGTNLLQISVHFRFNILTAQWATLDDKRSEE
jgi:hypothetical protein